MRISLSIGVSQVSDCDKNLLQHFLKYVDNRFSFRLCITNILNEKENCANILGHLESCHMASKLSLFHFLNLKLFFFVSRNEKAEEGKGIERCKRKL